jgi:hypothetical protein
VHLFLFLFHPLDEINPSMFFWAPEATKDRTWNTDLSARHGLPYIFIHKRSLQTSIICPLNTRGGV